MTAIKGKAGFAGRWLRKFVAPLAAAQAATASAQRTACHVLHATPVRRDARPLPVMIVALALAGCQSTAPKPQPITTANIPVVAACVDDASIDPLPQTAMPPRTAGPDALAAGAAADLLRYRELARRQQEMLKACAKVK